MWGGVDVIFNAHAQHLGPFCVTIAEQKQSPSIFRYSARSVDRGAQETAPLAWLSGAEGLL
jgi:hypothetical protein